ncbi:olfactory receptor 11A1-like [Chanos chanos]|uniref:Olfactory receptor n=1 Tax=Chanos chanos TaxID=29144 RepID=A0A6J2VPR6_CHACN|nr:olfactory receptor 11A1-like [Chanos chanos]
MSREENSTKVSSFVLVIYDDVGEMRYVYFTIFILIYIAIIFSNASLIGIICLRRTLHEPMYLFLCNLSVNDLYGSTALFPSMLIHLLSDYHTIPYASCFIQIFCLYTYCATELSTLAVISYDRYMSICYPLQYLRLITPCKVYILIFLTWLFSFAIVLTTISLSFSLQLCGNMIDRVYCDNFLVVRQACSDTTVNNIYGLFITVVVIGVTFSPILYSYIRILNICLRSSKEQKQKALNTCIPHIASLLNFSVGVLFVVIQGRYDLRHLPVVIRIVISVYFPACTPLFNPVMYGVRMTKIREEFKNVFNSKRYPISLFWCK